MRSFGLDDPWRFQDPGVDYLSPLWYWSFQALRLLIIAFFARIGVWVISLLFGALLVVSLCRRYLLHGQRRHGTTRGQGW